MTDVMIDFETLDTAPSATIIQAGACFFDRKTGEIGRTFKVNIDPMTSVKYGFTINPQTVYWWMGQSKEAIESVTKEPLVDIKQAMDDLNKFIQGAKCVWSHATFDFVILTEALKRLQIKPMFRYQSARDIRTLTDLAPLSVTESIGGRLGIHHDALDDCKFQVQYCVLCFKKLGIK